ncbi:MAG: murein biosynthesis integral membrane protein MurJ [Candidatus Shapirobacteria bacterium]|jgi:putative peptidoglycan lipid II flippase
MGLREKIHLFTQKKQHTILSASLVLVVTFGISAILGFLRSRFLYATFFKCCVLQLDVYNAAFRLPDLIFKLLVTGALSASFIPVFSGYLQKSEKKAYEIASSVINILLIIFFIAAVFVLIFARPLTALIAGGFSPEQLDLMVNLTRILLLAQIFFLLSNFITGILQVNQIFIIPALSPIVYNLFIIISIFTLAPIFGIYGVVYGAVIGAFFHLAIQIPVVKRQGFNYKLIINTKLSGVKEVFKLMIPRSLSLGLGEIENTVTLFFATTLSAGSISLLNLALQFMYLPSRIFGTTVGQASLPMLSKNIALKEFHIFRNTVTKILVQSLFIALPITILILVQRLSIIRLLFGSQQFPWSATLLTAKILAFLTPAIICQAIIQILIRSFYALHDTKTPFRISFVSLFFNIISSFCFIKFTNLGIIGLAISATIGNIIQLVGLLYCFVKAVDGFDWILTLKKVNKILLASLIMGFSTWASLKFLDLFILDTSRTLNLATVFSISSIFGIVVYSFVSKILKIEEFSEYQKYFFKFKDFVFRK